MVHIRITKSWPSSKTGSPLETRVKNSRPCWGKPMGFISPDHKALFLVGEKFVMGVVQRAMTKMNEKTWNKRHFDQLIPFSCLKSTDLPVALLCPTTSMAGYFKLLEKTLVNHQLQSKKHLRESFTPTPTKTLSSKRKCWSSFKRASIFTSNQDLWWVTHSHSVSQWISVKFHSKNYSFTRIKTTFL